MLELELELARQGTHFPFRGQEQKLDLNKNLRLMAETGASDLFSSTEAPVQIRIQGIIKPINDQPVSADHAAQRAQSLMSASLGEALHNADSRNNIALRLKPLGEHLPV